MSIAASFAKKCEQIWEDDPENLYEDFHKEIFGFFLTIPESLSRTMAA